MTLKNKFIYTSGFLLLLLFVYLVARTNEQAYARQQLELYNKQIQLLQADIEQITTEAQTKVDKIQAEIDTMQVKTSSYESILSIPKAGAFWNKEKLEFGNNVNKSSAKFTLPKIEKPIAGLPGKGMEYRNAVLYKYQQYLIGKGIKDTDLLRRASAILVHENEALTPDRGHDGNMGFGICGRYVKMHINTFKAKFPEEFTLDGQIRWCGDRFIHYYNLYGKKNASHVEYMPNGKKIVTTDGKFRLWVSHNCPACAAAGKNTSHLRPPYFQRVQYAYEKLQIL